jgi:hypothetical protein
MPREFVRTAQQALDQQRRDHEPGGLFHFARRAEAPVVALPPCPEHERTRQMRKDQVWPSKYLKASDFPEPRTLTIQHAKVEQLKNKSGTDTKLVVTFAGEEKTLPLNRINFDSICDITLEDDSDNWGGHKVVLYASVTSLDGKEVPCVRIKKPVPVKAKAKPVQAVEDWAEIDEDVPAL